MSRKFRRAVISLSPHRAEEGVFMGGTGTETVHQRLLDRAGLPVLPISAAEIERAAELAAKHGMTRAQEVDLHAPVITYVERFATESDRIAVRDEDRTLSYQELAEEARRIAALLIGHGIAPGMGVGVGGGG